MEILDDSLKAKYQVNKNLFVTCYLDVIEATAEGVKAQVGTRVAGDTVIPVGTKLYLALNPAKPKTAKPNEIELFYVTVEGVEIQMGAPIQIFSPIRKEIRTDMRKQERKETQFQVSFSGLYETGLVVINGSLGGLTLVDKADRPFVGLGLGSRHELNISAAKNLSFPVKVSHIHYDWRHNSHLLGIQILALTQEQKASLGKLIDPKMVIEEESKTPEPPKAKRPPAVSGLVDADKAMIRFDDP